MDRKSVKGKIVLCDGRFGPQKIGFASGATGIIIKTNKTELIDEDSIPFALPASVVNLRDGIETRYKISFMAITHTYSFTFCSFFFLRSLLLEKPIRNL